MARVDGADVAFVSCRPRELLADAAEVSALIVGKRAETKDYDLLDSARPARRSVDDDGIRRRARCSRRVGHAAPPRTEPRRFGLGQAVGLGFSGCRP
jgi:hypothetical protein